MKDVFNTVNSYTDIMINKSVQSFASWCKIKKVLLFNAPVSRKRKKLLDTETSKRLKLINGKSFQLPDKLKSKIKTDLSKNYP